MRPPPTRNTVRPLSVRRLHRRWIPRTGELSKEPASWLNLWVYTPVPIFAVDIYPEFIDKTRKRIIAAGWRNVDTVLGTERDPKLPANRLDAAILLDTYHHLNYPVATMRGVHRALKSGGRLFVIDYYRSRPHPAASPEQLRRHIRLDRDDVVKEVEAEGFHLAKTFDHMPFMYVLVFEKR